MQAKRKNHLTLVKLESKKQDKKVLASQDGPGGKFPSNNKKMPRGGTSQIVAQYSKLQF